MFFKFNLITYIFLSIGIFLFCIGLYWYKSKKYKDDIWVQNVGQIFWLAGCFIIINSIAFSVKFIH